MSTWAYCDRCESPLPMPVTMDAMIGSQKCQLCDQLRPLDDETRRVIIHEYLFGKKEDGPL